MLLLKSGHKEPFSGFFADLSPLLVEFAFIIGSVSKQEKQAKTMS